MNVIILEPARMEIDEAARYYDTKQEGLGTRFIDAVWATIDQVTESPSDGWKSRPRSVDGMFPGFRTP